MKKTIYEYLPVDWLAIFWPVLIYPAAYFPYRLWGVAPFAGLVELLIYGEQGNTMWLISHIEETILIFWIAVSAAALLTAVVIACLKVRPWRYALLYLMIKAGLYAILALMFYRLMT